MPDVFAVRITNRVSHSILSIQSRVRARIDPRLRYGPWFIDIWNNSS
jgi:hypothetical protein